MTPFTIKKSNGESVPVPCGRCPVCVKRRISGWSFRLMQEDRFASSSWFITLTYDTTHVPITRNGFMSLANRDLQLFFKRLRKAHDADCRIKYFAVGEYGGKTARPHYHAILFNADVKKIQPAWKLGEIHYGQVTGASVGYTLKYMAKKGVIPIHRNDDRVPEFSRMSKGLGAGYLSDAVLGWYLNEIENKMYCPLMDGRKIAMPRYYKDKIFSPLNFPSAEHADMARKRVAHFARLIHEEGYELLDYSQLWSKVQSDLAAFEKMKRDSVKGDRI